MLWYRGMAVWAALATFIVFQTIMRISFGMLRGEIITDFGISLDQFGDLLGVYYLTYAGMQLPAGILLDKFEVKSVTFVFIMIATAGLLMFGYADSWNLLICARLLIGIGSAATFVATAKVVKVMFPARIQSLMLSLTIMLGPAGVIIGNALIKPWLIAIGYKEAMLIFAIISAALGLAILSTKSISKDKQKQSGPSLADIKSILTNPLIVIPGMCAGLMLGTLEGFADVWAIPFFRQIGGFNANTSVLLSSIIFAGVAFGGPLLVWARSKFSSVFMCIFFTGVAIGSILAILLFFPTLPLSIIMMLAACLGLMCGNQTIIFDVAMKTVNPKLAGAAAAIVNTLTMIFGSFFHKIISTLMHHNWQGQIDDNGQYLYNAHAYIVSLSPIIWGCAIGSIACLYLHCRTTRANS